jgi:hypothetical protein
MPTRVFTKLSVGARPRSDRCRCRTSDVWERAELNPPWAKKGGVFAGRPFENRSPQRSIPDRTGSQGHQGSSPVTSICRERCEWPS